VAITWPADDATARAATRASRDRETMTRNMGAVSERKQWEMRSQGWVWEICEHRNQPEQRVRRFFIACVACPQLERKKQFQNSTDSRDIGY
jgi:hypothetical protein